MIARCGDSLRNQMSAHDAGISRCDSMNSPPQRPMQLYVPLLGATQPFAGDGGFEARNPHMLRFRVHHLHQKR